MATNGHKFNFVKFYMSHDRFSSLRTLSAKQKLATKSTQDPGVVKVHYFAFFFFDRFLSIFRMCLQVATGNRFRCGQVESEDIMATNGHSFQFYEV